MTVQELIEKLQQVEDKSMKVMFTTHVDARFGVNCEAEFAEIIRYSDVEEAKDRDWYYRFKNQGSVAPFLEKQIEELGGEEAWFKRHGNEKRLYLRDKNITFHDWFIEKKL